MNTADFFVRKKFSSRQAREYGFSRRGTGWVYHTALASGRLLMQVTVYANGLVQTEVTDPKTRAPYVLHTVERANGKFVGAVKEEFESVLRDIAARCFEPDVFKSKQAVWLIKHVRSAYGGELEYLWKRFPDNAVWRRADNRKWYGALLVVNPQKLGLPAGGNIDILDVRMTPEQAWQIDGKIYFAGYHMNKQHWMTVKLDGSVEVSKLKELMDISYRLAG